MGEKIISRDIRWIEKKRKKCGERRRLPLQTNMSVRKFARPILHAERLPTHPAQFLLGFSQLSLLHMHQGSHL